MVGKQTVIKHVLLSCLETNWTKPLGGGGETRQHHDLFAFVSNRKATISTFAKMMY